MRFKDLSAEVADILQKMLATNLRLHEADGLAARQLSIHVKSAHLPLRRPIVAIFQQKK